MIGAIRDCFDYGVVPESPDVQYSLRKFEDGRKFVDVAAEQERFDHLSANEQQKAAKKAIQEKFDGKVICLTNRAFVNGNTAKEYAFPSKSIKDLNTREAKMRSSTELDNLLEAGENFRTEPDGRDGHVHPNATGDFRYFDTLFKVGNEYYTGVINIMPVNKGLLLKDITKIRNVTKDMTGSYGENPQSRFLRDASVNSIRFSGGNSQEKSGESALYQRRDNTRTERDVLSDAADGDAANVRETVTGAGCSAIWTDRPTGEKTFLRRRQKKAPPIMAAYSIPIVRASADLDGTSERVHPFHSGKNISSLTQKVQENSIASSFRLLI